MRMQKEIFPLLPASKPAGIFRVMCLGDVVGKPGIAVLRRRCRSLREELAIDFVIANGENGAGGVGIDGESLRQIRSAGVDVVTLGDHVWSRKELVELLEKHPAESLQCIRPANYPEGSPGSGVVVIESPGVRVAVLNLLGRVFSTYLLDCPFRKADALIESVREKADVIVLDFHCDATSEKIAMGRYLDGRVSLVTGTHTHVQTLDAQVLGGGTGYITDLGMCGVADGVIGMDRETALKRFLTAMPHSYKAASGHTRLSGVIADIDTKLHATVLIEPVNIEVKV